MRKYIDELNNFMNSDWKEIVLNWWNNISPVSKKSFLWIFGIVNLVFLWHTITFFWGNHDWGQIKQGITIGWSLFDGRWGAGVIQQVTGGDILPVWNNLFCFAGFALAVVFLAKYWELPKNIFIYTIFGLFIILMPYTPPWMQYVRSETHFWNVFLIVFALYICSYKKLWTYGLAFILLLFCLGCYAAMLPTLFIIFLGRCVLDVWFENEKLSDLVKERRLTALVIIFSLISFAAIWLTMKQCHVLNGFYAGTTVQNANIYTLFNNFIHIGTDIRNTFFYNLPYIPTGFKMLLGLAIPIVIFQMTKLTKKQTVLLTLLFLGIIISSQFINLLSVNDYSNQLRIDFWTMPYIYSLFWVILLKQGKCWENIAILFICIAILFSGLQDIRDQKVKYFDKLHDVRIFDDVIMRIKSNPNFDPKMKYNILLVGEVSSNLETTAFDIYNSRVDWQNTWAAFIPNWNAKEYLDFYEKESYVAKHYSTFEYIPNYYLPDNVLKSMDTNYLLNIAKPYPNPNSVHIDDNYYIYIIFTQEELNRLRYRIKKL